MTPEAMAYLSEALDYIQKTSIKREQIDWSALRQDVFDLVSDAQTSAETYPALDLTLKRLGDNHSSLFRPEQEQQRLTGITKRIGCARPFPKGSSWSSLQGVPHKQLASR